MAGGYRENNDSYSDMDEEQSSIISMLITFVGLVAAAALICFVVWGATHKEVKQEVGSLTLPDSPPLAETLVESQPSAEPIVKEEEEEDIDPVNGDASMAFNAVEESVTAKDVAVLRSVPNTDGISTIVGQLTNGQTVKRVGVNKQTGWSKVVYNGQEVFAVSYTLTKDLHYKADDSDSSANRVTTADGRIIVFKDCEDIITAKEVVNLRTEPSTSQGTATVSCQLSSGGTARRTGFSADSGWSRVEYNGQTLYVVTSYIQEVGE